MKCQGNFVFKSLTHRPAGTFKNNEGQEIPYKSAYVLKVDEISQSGDINERKFNIAEDKVQLINDLKNVEAYEKIILTFNITLYTARVGIELTDVEIS